MFFSLSLRAMGAWLDRWRFFVDFQWIGSDEDWFDRTHDTGG